MYPYINILNKELTTYALMVLVGVLVAGFLAVRKSQKYLEDDNDMIKFSLFLALGAFIGGHILYGITNANLIVTLFKNLDKITSFGMFIKCLQEIFGGSVFYGGLIGGLFTAWLYAKKTKKDAKLYFFIATPFLALFHFFGRIGCFLYGCCYGVESSWGFKFVHSPIASANGVVRFPVQLVEALGILIIFFVLLYFQRKEKFKNTLLYVYLISYGILRFILEFFRGDEYRGFFLGLSTSQLISIVMIIFSIVSIYKMRKK